jgi:hypothetical protein
MLNEFVTEAADGSYTVGRGPGSPLSQAILWAHANEGGLHMGVGYRDLITAFTQELPRIVRDQATPEDRELVKTWFEQKIRHYTALAAR